MPGWGHGLGRILGHTGPETPAVAPQEGSRSSLGPQRTTAIRSPPRPSVAPEFKREGVTCHPWGMGCSILGEGGSGGSTWARPCGKRPGASASCPIPPPGPAATPPTGGASLWEGSWGQATTVSAFSSQPDHKGDEFKVTFLITISRLSEDLKPHRTSGPWRRFLSLHKHRNFYEPRHSFIRARDGFFALAFTCDVCTNDDKLLNASSFTEALSMVFFLFPTMALFIPRECGLMKCSDYATALHSKGAAVRTSSEGSLWPLGRNP